MYIAFSHEKVKLCSHTIIRQQCYIHVHVKFEKGWKGVNVFNFLVIWLMYPLVFSIIEKNITRLLLIHSCKNCITSSSGTRGGMGTSTRRRRLCFSPTCHPRPRNQETVWLCTSLSCKTGQSNQCILDSLSQTLIHHPHSPTPLTSKHGWRAAPKNWGKAAAILVQSKSRCNCTTFNEGPMGHSRIWSK